MLVAPISVAGIASISGTVIDGDSVKAISIVATFTGLSSGSSGTLQVQGSNDPPNGIPSGIPGNWTPTNWAPAANGTANVSASGTLAIEIPDTRFRWFRVVWTATVGSVPTTGTLLVNVSTRSWT
ncbi:MAG: hypothetical protein ACHQ5A_02390 [Opitutales bacterium]